MEADGIMGLAFSSLSNAFPTGMDMLQKQGIISRRLFSIYLGTEGEYLLSNLQIGGYDIEKYSKG